MPIDTYTSQSLVPDVTEPAVHAFAVTPHDTNNLSYTTRGLFVGAAGNVKVIMAGGETVTFTALAAGMIHPIRCTRVFATDTTATGIVGVY